MPELPPDWGFSRRNPMVTQYACGMCGQPLFPRHNCMMLTHAEIRQIIREELERVGWTAQEKKGE